MQFPYPYYVAPVHSVVEESDEPTHCSFEIRPTTVLRLTWYTVLVWLLKRLASRVMEARFLFPRMQWLAAPLKDQALRLAVILDHGGVLTAQEIEQVFWKEAQDLQGYEVDVSPSGSLRLLSHHKYSGTEFFSEEIPLGELLKAVRLRHLLAEIQGLFRRRRS